MAHPTSSGVCGIQPGIPALQALNHGLALDAIFPGDVVLVPAPALDRAQCFLGLTPRPGPLRRADPDNPASPFVLEGPAENREAGAAPTLRWLGWEGTMDSCTICLQCP